MPVSKASERVKRWRKANPEKYRAQRRKRSASPEFRAKERERNRKYKKSEAGRAARRISRVRNKTRENLLSGIARKRRHLSDPRSAMLYSAKHRAKRDGVAFDLVKEDIYVPELCPLLGIALSVSAGVLSDNSPTLDRIFNAQGYVPGNIVVISYAANRCKGNLCANDIAKLAANLKFLEAIRASR